MKKLWLLVILMITGMGCNSPKYLLSKGNLVEKEVFDVTLPVHISSNVMIVTLKIEGEDYRFLFDTGAPMVVDKGLRQKYAMKTLTSKRVGDSQGNSQQLDYVKMPPFQFGGVTAKGVVALEADLKKTPGVYCLNLDGIVGANFMRMGFWEMNAVDSTVRFTNDFSRINTDSISSVVPFRVKATGTPIVNVRLNGSTLPYVTFDTGSSGVLGIPSKNVASGFDDSLSVFSTGYHSAGLFGSRLDSTYKRQFRFSFGQDSLPNLPVDIDHPGAKKLLGMGYLKHYRVVLNWQTQKIYLQRLKTLKASTVTRFGIHPFLQDSVLTVGAVYAKLLAAQKAEHLTLGDTILKLNNLDVRHANHLLFCDVVQEFRSSDTVEVQLKNKPTVLLTQQPLFKP